MNIKFLTNIFTIAILALLLSACASPQPENYTGQDAAPLLLSIEVKNSAPDGAYFIHIRNKQTEEVLKYKFVTGYSVGGSTPDFTLEDGQGLVFANLVKPGEYEFIKVGLESRGPALRFSSVWEGNEAFTIEEDGKYLGSFVFSGNTGDYITGTFDGRNYDYLNGANSIDFDLTNEGKRDVKIAYEKYNFMQKRYKNKGKGYGTAKTLAQR